MLMKWLEPNKGGNFSGGEATQEGERAKNNFSEQNEDPCSGMEIDGPGQDNGARIQAHFDSAVSAAATAVSVELEAMEPNGGELGAIRALDKAARESITLKVAAKDGWESTPKWETVMDIIVKEQGLSGLSLCQVAKELEATEVQGWLYILAGLWATPMGSHEDGELEEGVLCGIDSKCLKTWLLAMDVRSWEQLEEKKQVHECLKKFCRDSMIGRVGPTEPRYLYEGVKSHEDIYKEEEEKKKNEHHTNGAGGQDATNEAGDGGGEAKQAAYIDSAGNGMPSELKGLQAKGNENQGLQGYGEAWGKAMVSKLQQMDKKNNEIPTKWTDLSGLMAELKQRGMSSSWPKSSAAEIDVRVENWFVFVLAAYWDKTWGRGGQRDLNGEKPTDTALMGKEEENGSLEAWLARMGVKDEVEFAEKMKQDEDLANFYDTSVIGWTDPDRTDGERGCEYEGDEDWLWQHITGLEEEAKEEAKKKKNIQRKQKEKKEKQKEAAKRDAEAMDRSNAAEDTTKEKKKKKKRTVVTTAADFMEVTQEAAVGEGDPEPSAPAAAGGAETPVSAPAAERGGGGRPARARARPL